MKNSKKILLIIILTIFLVPTVVFASVREQYKNGHWYLYDEQGNMLTGFQYLENGNKTCFYNSNGWMLYGQQMIGGHWYLFDSVTGAMQTGFKYISSQNKTVYYNEQGQMLYGFQKIGNYTYYFDTLTGATSYGQKIINGHWHLFDSYGIMKTGFQYISYQNKTVYYNADGWMLYGLQTIGEDTYYFDPVTGAMKTGYLYLNGKHYMFASDGKKINGKYERLLNTGWHYFDEDGNMLTGFQYIESQNKTCYYSKTTGAMLYGEQYINGHWYLFDTYNGAMKTGFQYISNQNKTVYYNEQGQMLYGLQDIGEDTYYFDTITGAKKSGIVTVDGKSYLFYSSGKQVKRTGEVLADGYWYLLNDKYEVQKGFQTLADGRKVYYTSLGRMVHGQLYLNGYWYLFDTVTGEMKTGFQILNDEHKTVYYDESGHMLYGYHTIDGVQYYFNTVTGAMKSNFVYKNGKTYYYFENGGMANDWINIAGTKYFFNSLGEMIGKNVQKVVDVSSYQTNINWYTAKTQGGVDGAILRISAGCEWEDPQLAYNIQGVKNNNIPYGIYIYSYAENYNEGVLYAQFTLEKIRKYGMNPSLGIYLDLENNGVTSYMGVAQYTEVVRGFMDTMQAAGYGHLAKVYTYTSYANTALNSEYIRSQIDWIAQYYHYTTYTGPIRMWQYSSTEKVAGINGNVDVSVKFY